MNLRNRSFFFCLLVCASLLTPTLAFTQATSSIRGTVSDPTNAMVPGVSITLENVGTGATRTTLSDDTGSYQILQIPPGTYRIRAELSGFKTVVRDNLQLLVNTPTTLNMKFEEVGQITETVEVSGAAAPAVNTVDATIGQTIQNSQIVALPLEGRNVVGLLSLQPGVVYTGIENDTRSGAVSGSRSDQTNVTLDGVDVNDQQTGKAFESVLPVTLDSVQEFRVVTSNANASQGRSSGGQVAMVTKSGTNQLHGSAYEYHRNTITTANDFFNNSTGVKRPKLIRNVFGGSVGGPIKKDRAFFFFNYEGTQERRGQNVLRIVPTVTAKQGIIQYRRADSSVARLTPDEIRQRDPLKIGVNPAVLELFRQYPDGNDPTQGDDAGLNFMGLRFVAPMARKNNSYIARFDYVSPDSKNLLFWRGALADWDEDEDAPQMPGQPAARKRLTTSRGFAAGHTWTVSPTLINDLRYGFTRQGINLAASSNRDFKVRLRGWDDPESWATRSVARYVPVHNITDDVTKIAGTHTVQVGGNIRWVRNRRSDATNSVARWSSNNGFMNNLGRGLGVLPPDIGSAFRTPYVRAFMGLLGTLNQADVTYYYNRDGSTFTPPHVPQRTFANNEYEFYVQDQWKMFSNQLTMTAGVRYGYYAPPYEVKGFQVRPTFDLDNWFAKRAEGALQGIPANQSPLLAFKLGGKANNGEPLYDPDKNNFAPRLSFAWTPTFRSGPLHTLFGDPGRSSVRFGGAMFNERIGGGLLVTADINGAVGLAANSSTPTGSFDYDTSPRFTGLTSLPTLTRMNATAPRGGFPSSPAALVNDGPIVALQGFVNNTRLRTPYSYMFNFSISRDLPGDVTVETAYVGRMGRKLLAKVDYAAQLINLRDARSGQTWSDALRIVEQLLDNNASVASVQPIPYIENMFAPLAGGGRTASQQFYNIATGWAPSWTDLMHALDVERARGATPFGRATFFQQQFDYLAGWSNLGGASYHSFQLLVRKRFTHSIQADFNYTLSKSIDNGSPVENSGTGAGLIYNPFKPRDSFQLSDFDIRHQVNSNFIVELPFGKNKAVGGNMPRWADQILGGWQFTGLIRWREGFPLSVNNGFNFPTNYFNTGPGTLKPGATKPGITVDKSNAKGPNVFGDSAKAFDSFKNTSSGDSGSRNNLIGPRFFNIDSGLHKSFHVAEGKRIVFRWETFNVTNRVNFDGIANGANSTGIDLNLDNKATFGKFRSTAGNPRIMQFALRFEF